MLISLEEMYAMEFIYFVNLIFIFVVNFFQEYV